MSKRAVKCEDIIFAVALDIQLRFLEFMTFYFFDVMISNRGIGIGMALVYDAYIVMWYQLDVVA